MMGYDTLENYFRTTFAMMHHHKYNLTELENMIPWEKTVYLDLLKAHIKQQNEANRDMSATQAAIARRK